MKDIFPSRKLYIYIRIACLVLSLSIFSGCSWASSFYVINSSEDDIMISYRVSRYISSKPTDNIDFSDCFETSARSAPYILENVRKASELRPASSDWRQLNSNEYFCDVEERVVNFRIAPQTAVEIHWESNYLGHEKESEQAMESGRVHRLGIEPLRLEGSQGSIVYEGDQVTKAFEEKNSSTYVIEYN
ncbi:MAG: hypothetical protein AAF215_26220 [Cyanobacteria bacterium P01_A01_bin.123]